MPELPDLLYIKNHLDRNVCRHTITKVDINQPVVLRVAVEGRFGDLLTGKTITSCTIHGPFIKLDCSGDLDLVMNLMLAGKLQHQRQHEKGAGHLCFSLFLNDGSRLNLCDEQKMAKAYLVRHGEYAAIPKYREQGVDIMSPVFTLPLFVELAKKHTRKQVRVFLNDHTILSSIGNAYADEILFEAKIHPKTFVARLPDEVLDQLYHSILSVMKWGIEQVESAAQPIHIKVRDHMNVRNRKDQPCPRCGTKIRREGVRGYDVFFCPKCQAPTRKSFIDWNPT
ncbi:MAG: DNA-formamidopyrimidine glycosylase [Bacteroidetes bacterium]|nr:DNA-formamidopyrimidine glycosylase [Bacteroidota bacterium]MCW5896869.1 DNA-formamidopyrimidine glycosylase [Bacteroidota bacterium]